MGSNQTWKLLYSKIKHKTRRQPTDWKKIFADDATDKGLISKIKKQLTHFNNNKKKITVKNLQANQSENGQKT